MRGKTSAVQNAKQKAKTTKPRRKEELIHMKFTVEKRLLNEAVTNLQRAVSSKTSIPALEGIPHPQRRKPPHFNRLRS